MNRGRQRVLRRLRAQWGQAGSAVPRWGDAGALHRLVRERGTSTLLDEQTCRDLLLDEVQDRLDGTLSGLGRQALYHRLRSLPDADDRERFERLVVAMARDSNVRERVQLQLMRLEPAPSAGPWLLCQPDQVPAHGWFIVFPLLFIGIIASGLAILVWPRALLLLILLVAAAIGLRTVVYWQSAHILNPLRQLGPALDVAKALVGEADVARPDEELELRGALRALAPIRPILRWIARDPLTSGELTGVLLEYLNLLLVLDANAMFLTARRLRRHHAELFRLLCFIGRVDAAQGVASLRARPEAWSVPELVADGDLDVVEAWHPVVADPVPNSFRLEPGRGLLVTGSNMSGKSTFLRTAGLVAALARSINTCPARSYRGPLLTATSCMQIADDLFAGRSTYLAQAEVAVGMLRQRDAAEPHLFILDELFRGTNTVERIAAGEAFLRELLSPAEGRTCRHMAVAATHDGELVALLAPDYQPVHFGEQVVEGELVFDHRLLPGPAGSRSALRLLSLLGAPDSLLDAANARVAAIEAERAR